MKNKSIITCDMCGYEIIAHKSDFKTDFFTTDTDGNLLEDISAIGNSEEQIHKEVVSYHCSNPECRQEIGDADDFRMYVGNTDYDEFRLFKQLDVLTDVIEELCRMQLHTDSLNASVVIRNTLKDMPKKLPVIIEMKRKMVERDFIDKVDFINFDCNL